MLECAQRLATVRVRAEGAASSAASEAAAAPWVGSSPDVVPGPNAVIAADLVRAVVAVAPEEVGALLPGGPSELFRERAQHWLGLADAPALTELECGLRRQFAYADRVLESPPVTLGTLLSVLGFDAQESLAALSDE